MKFQTPEGGCMWPHHVESPICVYDRESFEKYKSGEYQLPTHCICGVELSYDDLNSICICLVEQQQQTGDIILHTPYPLQRVNLRIGDEVYSSSIVADTKDKILKERLDKVELRAPEAWEKTGEGFGQLLDPRRQSLFRQTLFGKGEEGLEAYEVPDRIRKRLDAEADMIEQDLGMSMGCKVEPNPVAYGLRHIDRITVRCKITGNELEACALPNGIVRWSCPCGFRYEKMIGELGLAPNEILIDEYCEGKGHEQDSETQTSAQVQKEED